MPDFNPAPNELFRINGKPYKVMPHPAVPTFAFGQEGRKAYVFQVHSVTDGAMYALKKFKLAFRVPELVEVCEELAHFSRWNGLEACARICLNQTDHPDILGEFEDLEYAVLMPWIMGSTWYDLVIAMTPLNRLEAITFANGLSQVLSALEEAGIAHCDISAANVIINPNTGRAHLIDVEDLYAPGFLPPNALPAGTDGYAHRTAGEGIWKPTADRFAGAVIMAEMAGWYDPRVRKEAEEEHYFSPTEMQEDCPRYQLMMEVLGELDPRLAELFEKAWFSETLDDAPRLAEWQSVFSEVHRRESLSEVVSDWQPLIVPGVETGSAEPVPIQPVAVASAPAEDEDLPAEEVQEIEQAEDEDIEEVVSAVVEADEQDEPAPIVDNTHTAPTQVFTPAQVQQAVQTPMPPPMAPAPVMVQTEGQSGPVVEWRPLAVPTEDERNSGFEPLIVASAPPPQPVEVVEEVSPFEPVDSSEAEESDMPEEETQTPEEPIEQAEAEIDDQEDEEVIVEDEVVPVALEEPEEIEEAVQEIVPEETYEEEIPVTEEPVQGLQAPILNYTDIDRMNRPLLVWSESFGADSYILQESKSSGFDDPKEIHIKGSDNTQWKPHWGRSGRMFYRIKALNDSTDSPWSEVLGIRIGK